MEQKELTYAQQCGKASRRTKLPFEVVLAISYQNADLFEIFYKSIKSHYESVGIVPFATRYALELNDYRGMWNAKEVLSALIDGVFENPVEGDGAYKLKERIDSLGFKNLQRVCDYMSEIWSKDNDD